MPKAVRQDAGALQLARPPEQPAEPLGQRVFARPVQRLQASPQAGALELSRQERPVLPPGPRAWQQEEREPGTAEPRQAALAAAPEAPSPLSFA